MTHIIRLEDGDKRGTLPSLEIRNKPSGLLAIGVGGKGYIGNAEGQLWAYQRHIWSLRLIASRL